MFFRVCRAFHALPDEIRGIEVNDYLGMLECIGEVPTVDEAFYYSFCKTSGKGGKKTDLTSCEARKNFLGVANV